MTNYNIAVHYYQRMFHDVIMEAGMLTESLAGIGTYITNGTLSRVHVMSRMKSWCQKGLDAAVGHVH